MKRIGIVAVLAIVLGALPLVAYGRGQRQGGAGGRGAGGGQWGPGGPPGIMQMLRQLDLTDAQREQLARSWTRRGKGDRVSRSAPPNRNCTPPSWRIPDPQAIEGLKATLNTAHARSSTIVSR